MGACPEKKIWVVATLYFSSSCPRKSQMAPSKSLYRVRLKGRVFASIDITKYYHFFRDQNNRITTYRRNDSDSFHLAIFNVSFLTFPACF
jgi:hypothetical protein